MSNPSENDKGPQGLKSPEEGAGTAEQQAGGAGKLSAGDRLRAAKRAKAEKKAAKRGEDDLMVEAKAGKAIEGQYRSLSRWATKNPFVFGALALVVVGGAAAAGYWYKEKVSTERALTEKLGAALETATASVGTETPPPSAQNPSPEAPKFSSGEKRAESAAKAFESLAKQYPNTKTKPWLLLAEGAAQLRLGKTVEARLAYNKALKEGGKDPLVSWRAFEGLGQVAIESKNYSEAKKHFRQIKELAGGQFAALARFRLAEVSLLEGNEGEAKKALESLQKDLRKETASAGLSGGGGSRALLSRVDEELRWLEQ